MKAAKAKKHDVTVFSTPSCPYCVMLKAHLDQKKVVYRNIDVSEDQKMGMEMFMKSHQMGVPQIWIDENIIVGFDPTTIDQLLS